jgi:hypothetical protein
MEHLTSPFVIEVSLENSTRSGKSALTPDDMMIQSCPEANPVKWHLAHTTWFFESFALAESTPDYVRCHPDFIFGFDIELPKHKARLSRIERPNRISFQWLSGDAVATFVASAW